MNILAIGNSFSQDSCRYLYNIAESAGTPLTVVNLCIGGCSLAMHAENAQKHLEAYDYELNGGSAIKRVTIEEVLRERHWDAVTIQQASHFSGQAETYEPYGTELIECIKKYAPGAKIYFHMTWAYEVDSNHSCFAWYNSSQQEMYARIQDATEGFAKSHGIDIIPTGKVIQALRSRPEFDYKNGGISLCRDGFHLSMTYGRFAAAATWYQRLAGDISLSSFLPEDTDCTLIRIIEQTVADVVK